MDGAAWMNGAIVPIAQAKLHVTDWGLTRSDITYDVVKVWQGRFFRLDLHVERFLRSCERLRLDIGMDAPAVRDVLHEMVAASGLEDAYVSMCASRGRPSVPGTRDPRLCANHFYAWCVPFVWVFPPDVVERGAALMMPDGRQRIDPAAVDPTIKNYHWGDFTAALLDAKDAGFDSCLLLDGNGLVTEGAGFNVFCAENGRLLTPRRGALEGVTRRTVLEVAEELEIAAQETDIPAARFLAADEAFACTTAGGITPIARVNDATYPVRGAMTARVMSRFMEWHDRPDIGEPVRRSPGLP